jgi:regulator of protease activity HflC (stomatin/prohibitin superfamily)
VGKIDLDRTFEERTNINTSVVSELDKASESWGVKVLRYEIKNITPPPTCWPRWRSRCAPSARSAR